jgi:MraZ protein
VEPLFLSGEFDLTLDDKSRLMVPAQFRKRISPAAHGDGFYLVVSPGRTLKMFPNLYYEWLTMQRPVEDLPDRASQELDRLNFAVGGGVVDSDKAGRIVLNEKVRRRVGLGRDVTVIGARDHLEVWNTADWEKYSDDLLSRGNEIESLVRAARLSPSALSHGSVLPLAGSTPHGSSLAHGRAEPTRPLPTSTPQSGGGVQHPGQRPGGEGPG